MKVIIGLVISLVSYVACASNVQAETKLDINQQPRFALVIGNSRYLSVPSLTNSKNNAVDIANSLRKLKFNVDLKTNGSFAQLKSALKKFSDNIRQSHGVGLFYFSGYSIQLSRKNYLIPIDTNFETGNDIRMSAYSLDWLIKLMKNAGNILSIIILDTSSQSTQLQNTQGFYNGLAPIEAGKNMFIAYATQPNDTVINSKSGRNSVYTSMLLRHIAESELSIAYYFQKVSSDVKQETDNKQKPWVSQSIVEKFYFSPKIINIHKSAPISVSTITPPILPAANTKEDIEAFEKARAEIRELEDEFFN